MDQSKEQAGEPTSGSQTSSSAASSPNQASSSPTPPEAARRLPRQMEDTMDGDDEDSGDSEESESMSRKQRRKNSSGKGKLDRSKLRKGKWTVEEEEYTSRIIHYFGIGLLTLPEGATLRSYLAEKLNCDPMRITKKYAGASCLGRRVYHFQNRVQPTVADIQVAKTELDHLEHRFRARAAGEAGAGSLPEAINTSHSIVSPSSVQAAPVAPATNQTNSNPLQALLTGLNQAAAAQGNQQFPHQPMSIASLVPVPSQAPVASAASVQPQAIPAMQMLMASLLQAQQNQNPGNVLHQLAASNSSQPGAPSPWAFPQAIASLNPMYQQLAATTTPQPQLPSASAPTSYDQTTSLPPPPATTTLSQSQATAPTSQQQRIQETLAQLSHAQQLQAQIQQHQVKLQQQLAEMNASIAAPPVATGGAALAPADQKKRKSPIQGQKELKEAYERRVRSHQAAPPPPLAPPSLTAPPRSEEDTAAGNMLLGFLCSLRQSYEDALRNGNDSTQHPARVSDESNATSESGEANQSSIDDSDWNSDKKTDPSSSEDSDKEERSSSKRARISTHDANRHGKNHSKNGDNDHQVVHGEDNLKQEKGRNDHSTN